MRKATALLLIVLLPAIGPAEAQMDAVFRFRMDVPGDAGLVERGGQVEVPVTVYDDSLDPPNGQLPVDVTASPHDVRFRVTPLTDDPGWTAVPPVGYSSYAGDVVTRSLIIQATPQAQHNYFAVNLTTTITAPNHEIRFYHTVVARTEGATSFNVLARSGLTLAPREIGTAHITIQNNALYEQAFSLSVAENPCNIGVGLPSRIVMGPRSTVEETVSLQGPEEKFWYLFGEVCTVKLDVVPEGRELETRPVYLSATVQGINHEPPTYFWILVALLVLLLFFLFLKRRKEKVEEEILGKPQKPWTIPVEKVYLEHLKQKDERAWYVVRHHLMEEEYRSALLWYKSFKKATRGARTKERVILKEEKDYEAWRARWQKRIAAPPKKADGYEAALQRRLDRQARKAHRKDLRRWRKDTKRIEAAHAKKQEKAELKWQKAQARAAKKGQPAPPKPDLGAPDVPPEPQIDPIGLEEHRYGKKAARFRRKMERKQGNLEVQYEKADARKRGQVIKKMQKLARRLDDPDFVDEHPMLAEPRPE